MHTHFKDGTGSRVENYQGTVLGAGEIPLDWAIECLHNNGYEGSWTAEYEGPRATTAPATASASPT